MKTSSLRSLLVALISVVAFLPQGTFAKGSSPTPSPTPAPPTEEPSKDPTSDPTRDPTTDPTADPTRDPTNEPTSECTDWCTKVGRATRNDNDPCYGYSEDCCSSVSDGYCAWQDTTFCDNNPDVGTCCVSVGDSDTDSLSSCYEDTDTASDTDADLKSLFVQRSAGNGNAVSTFSMTAALVLVAVLAAAYFCYVLVRKSQSKKSLKYTWPEEEAHEATELLPENC